MWCSNFGVNNVYVCMQSDVCTTLVIACLAYWIPCLYHDETSFSRTFKRVDSPLCLWLHFLQTHVDGIIRIKLKSIDVFVLALIITATPVYIYIINYSTVYIVCVYECYSRWLWPPCSTARHWELFVDSWLCPDWNDSTLREHIRSLETPLDGTCWGLHIIYISTFYIYTLNTLYLCMVCMYI